MSWPHIEKDLAKANGDYVLENDENPVDTISALVKEGTAPADRSAFAQLLTP